MHWEVVNGQRLGALKSCVWHALADAPASVGVGIAEWARRAGLPMGTIMIHLNSLLAKGLVRHASPTTFVARRPEDYA